MKAIVQEAITAAAAAPGGAVAAAAAAAAQEATTPDEDRVKAIVAEAITTATAPGGLVAAAVAAAAQTATAGQTVTEARVTEIAAERYNTAADAVFSWRADLRAMSTTRYKRAWDGLMASPEHEAAVLDALTQDGGPMLTLLGLQATHPENARLNERLDELQRQAVSAKLPKLKWKPLCLPQYGGGAHRLRCHLEDKAESPEASTDVRALAKSCLAIMTLLEKRYCVLSSSKKSAIIKAEQQQRDLMPVIYHTIKAYKRRTVKSAASLPVLSEILLQDFGLDVVMGHLFAVHSAPQLFAGSPFASTSAGAARSRDEPAGKRPAAPPPAPPPKRPHLGTKAENQPSPPRGSANRWGRAAAAAAVAPPAPGTPPAPSKKELVDRFVSMLSEFAPGKSPDQIQQWFDERFSQAGFKSALQDVQRRVCKNCLLAGKGVFTHTLKACADAGNPCCIPCPLCVSAGRWAPKHWMKERPRRKTSGR